MSHKADPPNEGRYGSFFAPGKPRFGRRSAETRLVTKSYNVLQNHRKKYVGVVCLNYSDLDENKVFIFGTPFSDPASDGEHRHVVSRCRLRMAVEGMGGWPLTARAARIWDWSLFEQKRLAGIVFAIFWFEKTTDWLY